MSNPNEADRQIEQLERDLARVQTDTAYRQIEANLVCERLRSTLDIAVNIVHRLASGMDASVERMADDLNGCAEQ